MDKSILQTAAIIFTIVATAWHIGGEVKTSSAAIAELRGDMKEFRGLLITHIAGHSHIL